MLKITKCSVQKKRTLQNPIQSHQNPNLNRIYKIGQTYFEKYIYFEKKNILKNIYIYKIEQLILKTFRVTWIPSQWRESFWLFRKTWLHLFEIFIDSNRKDVRRSLYAKTMFCYFYFFVWGFHVRLYMYVCLYLYVTNVAVCTSPMSKKCNIGRLLRNCVQYYVANNNMGGVS